jgi:alanine dehydrogenase
MLTGSEKGWQQALADDPHFLPGVNVHDGQVTYRAVADAFGLKSVDGIHW